MKKRNILTILAAVVTTVGAIALLLYLFRDKIKECPLCGKFLNSDEDDEDFFDEDFFEELDAEDVKAEETAEDEEEEEAEEEVPEEKHAHSKVRRGYIPLKFHKEEAIEA